MAFFFLSGGDGKPKCFLSELPADANKIKVFASSFLLLLFRLQLSLRSL